MLADGSVITTGGRARKSSAGYDLTRLLVGSEGTLGIITELTLKLYGIPETILAGGLSRSPRSRAPATPPSPRCRWDCRSPASSLLDEVQIRACNAYSHLTLPETPTLFLEFHGTPVVGARAGRGVRRDRARRRGRATTLGPSAPRTAASSGRRATTPIGRRAR